MEVTSSVNNLTNFVYYSSKTKDDSQNKDNNQTTFSDQDMEKILQSVAKQAIKERTPSIAELERSLQEHFNQRQRNKGLSDQNDSSEEKQQYSNEENDETYDEYGSGEDSITKILQDKGYLKDSKRWLTKKGFFEIGRRLLYDVMKAINEGGYGFHETKKVGTGTVTLETTKEFELGDDMRYLNTPQSVMNTIRRLSREDTGISFPIELRLEDLEKYETSQEVKVSVVYCIDLSSTMKYSTGPDQGTRIEAAKKALWSLYMLNKKFFPNDSIYLIGFGSLASKINPRDIPYLKTYDANDNFLHYTNYQAAFRLANKLLKNDPAENKRIVLITDGQPSACFVENDQQKAEILSDRPYSNFYTPDQSTVFRMKAERNIQLDVSGGSLVYLCYRYKKVDPQVKFRTLTEAKKSKKKGIQVDTIMVSEEEELLKYVESLETKLKGRAYYINPNNIGKVLIGDFLNHKRKTLKTV